MAWVGANSFRTTHYPYSEQTMDLADRLGFLVIDETPAVGLFFLEEGLPRRLELCRRFTRELIARDRNHPSVIAWSLANEPHSQRRRGQGVLPGAVRRGQGPRPDAPGDSWSATSGVEEPAFAFSDLVCLNRYCGWYSDPAASTRAARSCPRSWTRCTAPTASR